MARLRGFWKVLSYLVLVTMLLMAGPADAGEIKDAAIMVMSGELDPVLASRVNDQTILYEVEAGDTLWGISRRYNVDWELILAMNNLNDTYIKSGQILVVPVIQEEIENKSYTYIIRRGDTLTEIARRFRVSLSTIIAKNEIDNPDLLLVGQKIVIPDVRGSIPVTKTYQDNIASRGRNHTFPWPVKGAITSRFGPRGNGFHHGLDIAGPKGTIIRAVAPGKVIFSGWKNRIYGNTVIIEHYNGFKTMYAHNNVNLVQEGDLVRTGRPVAKIGETGNATGPHVHFAITKGNKLVDPLIYLER